MRSPPRKPTASGSSKSSFHSKTPDGAGTSPAPPFSFPAPQQKAGIPGEAKEDILSVPAGGSSHYGARGRSLWRKAPSPLDPHPKHGGRHLTPSRRYDSWPEWAANRAVSSKAPRFIRPRRRLARFPPYPLVAQRGGTAVPNTVMAIRFPALMGRQSCHFLESTSLYPPPAALWCFPLWKSLPRKDGGATVEREAEDVLFATPVCEGLSGAGTH